MNAPDPTLGSDFIVGLFALAALAMLGYPPACFARPKGGDVGVTLAAAPGMGGAIVALVWLIAAYFATPAWQGLSVVMALAAGWAGWRLYCHVGRRDWIPPMTVVLGGTAALGWRIWQVRGLAFPPWVDAIHHAVVVRKMLELGQTPRELAPYLPGPFFYHFAFHGLTATLAAIARLGIPQAMLDVGQVLQAGVALSIYRLGWTLWGSRLWAGVAAVLALFAAQMPGHYTAWGKYPLLTAMVLTPLAISLALELLRDGSTPGRVIGLAITVAGAITAHYFAALTLGLFLTIVVVQALLEDRHREQRAWPGLLLGGGLGLMLAAPWIGWVWRNAGRFIAVQAGEALPTPDQAYFPGYLAYLWALTGPLRSRLLLALALPGLGLALRRPVIRSIGVWSILLLALGSPWGWRLQPFSPDRVLIILWLPAVLLATETLAWLVGRLDRAGRSGKLLPRATGIVSACVVAWCAWGAVETTRLVSDDDVLAVAEDAPALAWVEAHVPADARFFIDVAPWPPYGYRGVDGGWWLLPAAGRQTVLPPALYGLGDSREVERLNALATRAAAISGCGPAFWDLVTEARLTHVYLNAARGALQPRGFDGCPAVEPIYAAGDVFVYRLLWPPIEEREQ